MFLFSWKIAEPPHFTLSSSSCWCLFVVFFSDWQFWLQWLWVCDNQSKCVFGAFPQVVYVSFSVPLHVLDVTYINISDAAKVGDLETLKSAFARGVSVDQRDKYYKTPLMAACAHGNIEVAAYLLQIGWVNSSGVHCNLVLSVYQYA